MNGTDLTSVASAEEAAFINCKFPLQNKTVLKQSTLSSLIVFSSLNWRKVICDWLTMDAWKAVEVDRWEPKSIYAVQVDRSR